MDNLILDALPDPVILIDGNRKVVGANKATGGLLGAIYTGEDLSLTLRHPDVLEAVDKVLASGKTKGTEVSFPHPVFRTFEISISAISGSADEPAGVRAFLVLHDITATRAAESIRSEFIANVSHELRSPLVSLIGFLETLQSSAKDDPVARDRFLSIMEGEAGRMKALIDDLLSLSKIETNEHIRPEGRVNLYGILKMVAETLSQKAARKTMSIDIAGADDLPDITGDSQELTQIFTNLIENAIKYGNDDSAVTVRLSLVDRIPNIGGKGLCVSVHNYGETIAPEYLPRLTQRFFRIDKSRSRSVGGTGLGLAIVKHLVNHHRGRLVTESNEADGTRFSVYLPL